MLLAMTAGNLLTGKGQFFMVPNTVLSGASADTIYYCNLSGIHF